ncbi:MAG: DUF2004 domain-containing protein [Pseudomonadota bacterium]
MAAIDPKATFASNRMPTNLDEIARREAAAREQINTVYGRPEDEFGATLFVFHHLNEIDPSYWTKHFANTEPEPRQVLRSLVLRSHWGGEDEIDNFDFTLPNGVTDYVISVAFDEAGQVVDISMES